MSKSVEDDCISAKSDATSDGQSPHQLVNDDVALYQQRFRVSDLLNHFLQGSGQKVHKGQGQKGQIPAFEDGS